MPSEARAAAVNLETACAHLSATERHQEQAKAYLDAADRAFEARRVGEARAFVELAKRELARATEEMGSGWPYYRRENEQRFSRLRVVGGRE